eukprot:1554265-Pyramimonas_sp.AAC.1
MSTRLQPMDTCAKHASVHCDDPPACPDARRGRSRWAPPRRPAARPASGGGWPWRAHRSPLGGQRPALRP